jgi:hypothetical protein
MEASQGYNSPLPLYIWHIVSYTTDILTLPFVVNSARAKSINMSFLS